MKQILALTCAAAGIAWGGSPVHAQADPGAGPSFLTVRFASRSANAMYSGYTAGPLLLVAGMLYNPRSEYREVMGGVGHSWTGRRLSLTVAPAVAYSNTGWYGQLYLLPTLPMGALTLTATLQFAEPLNTRGLRGAYVSPANLLRDLGNGWSTGAAYYGSAEEASRPGHGVGPALQRAIPRGTLTLELIKGFAAAGDEVRVTLRSGF